MKSNDEEKFIPYTVVLDKVPAWKTPDFNPDANQRVAGNSHRGLSTKTQAELLRLDQQQAPTQSMPAPHGQTMQSTNGMVQLPNGQFVTPQQYQMLMQKLKNR
jgi:hypothetical protein